MKNIKDEMYERLDKTQDHFSKMISRNRRLLEDHTISFTRNLTKFDIYFQIKNDIENGKHNVHNAQAGD